MQVVLLLAQDFQQVLVRFKPHFQVVFLKEILARMILQLLSLMQMEAIECTQPILEAMEMNNHIV